MFQLNQAIQNWRSNLLENQTVTDADVDELESHFRDEIDSLMLAGLNEQEAFMVAEHRLGDEQTIGQEFAKVNPSLAWRRRAFWMLFGILVSMLVSGIAGVCSKGSAALMAWLNVNAYISGIASMLVHIGIFVALLFGIIFGLSLWTKGIKGRGAVSKILIVCMVLILLLHGASFAFQIIGVRLMGVEAIGKMALAANYTSLAWTVLWPIIVVVMLIWLWSSRPQRFC